MPRIDVTGRLAIVLMDGTDENRGHVQSIAFSLKGMTFDIACKSIDLCLASSQAEHEDDWDYDDVVERLKAVGFVCALIDGIWERE